MRFLLIVSVMTALSASAFAREGTVGGGGGAHIEAAFRLRAQTLIGQIENSPSASALCAAADMREALKSKIRVVDQLIDSATGQPPKETNLDAWTVPGDLQLLKTSWEKFFKAEEVKTGRSVDVLVLHEIYRATKSCNDEQFAISDKIFGLLEEPGIDSLVLKLGYKHPEGEHTSIHFTDRKGVPYDPSKYSPAYIFSTVTLCDMNIWTKAAVGKTANCMSISDEDTDSGTVYGMRFLRATVKKVIKHSFQIEVQLFVHDAPPPLLESRVDVSTLRLFENFTKGISTARPIYFVYNMEYGFWSYGFSTSRLTRLE